MVRTLLFGFAVISLIVALTAADTTETKESKTVFSTGVQSDGGPPQAGTEKPSEMGSSGSGRRFGDDWMGRGGRWWSSRGYGNSAGSDMKMGDDAQPGMGQERDTYVHRRGGRGRYDDYDDDDEDYDSHSQEEDYSDESGRYGQRGGRRDGRRGGRRYGRYRRRHRGQKDRSAFNPFSSGKVGGPIDFPLTSSG